MSLKRFPMLVLLIVCLALARPAAATAIANSSISFDDLTITPAIGSVTLLGPWNLEAFAQANNSLGPPNASFNFGTSPGSVNASSSVTWASAIGATSAPTDPPDLIVSGGANSAVNIPGCDSAAAFSQGRGTLSNFFTLSGGTGMVSVQFGADIAGALAVMADSCGLLAATETIFALEVDGRPVLFFQRILSVGPGGSLAEGFSMRLTNDVFVAVGPHFLLLEAETDPRGRVTVPEPPTGLLLLIGIGMLLWARKQSRRMS